MSVLIDEKVGASLAVVFWRQRRRRANIAAPGDNKFRPCFHRHENINFVKTFSQSVERIFQTL
jgi:hypothetical protein